MRPAPLFTELRAIAEIMTVPFTGLLAASVAPTGSPRPVLVLPGFASGDSATLALRTYLRSIGHHPFGWGQGINVGAAHHAAQGVDLRLTELYERYEMPIDLVGWSAGGVLARVLASHRTEMVRQVISLGTPIQLDTAETNLSGVSDLLGSFFVKAPSKIDVDKVPVPSTAVWTRRDGVVPGLACKQTVGPTAENVEVWGAHLGLPCNASVYYLIAVRLALPHDEWRPFDPPQRLRRCYPELAPDLNHWARAKRGTCTS